MASTTKSSDDSSPSIGKRILLDAGVIHDPVQACKVSKTSPIVIRFYPQKLQKISDEFDIESRTITIEDVLDKNKLMYDHKVQEIEIFQSSDSHNLLRSSISNGLIGSMFEAYSHHIPLELRPDEVWLSITTAFGVYVNHHPDLMREFLVTHKGRKDLTIELDGSYASLRNESFTTDFTAKLIEKMEAYNFGFEKMVDSVLLYHH